MSISVNRVTLLGHLGGEPEVRAFPDGAVVTNVSLATSERWKDRQSGEVKERTYWHRLVLRDFGNSRIGQLAGDMFYKGAKVYVEGSLTYRRYENKEGEERQITEVRCHRFIMLSGRQEEEAAPEAPPASTGNLNTDFDDVPF